MAPHLRSTMHVCMATTWAVAFMAWSIWTLSLFIFDDLQLLNWATVIPFGYDGRNYIRGIRSHIEAPVWILYACLWVAYVGTLGLFASVLRQARQFQMDSAGTRIVVSLVFGLHWGLIAASICYGYIGILGEMEYFTAPTWERFYPPYAVVVSFLVFFFAGTLVIYLVIARKMTIDAILHGYCAAWILLIMLCMTSLSIELRHQPTGLFGGPIYMYAKLSSYRGLFIGICFGLWMFGATILSASRACTCSHNQSICAECGYDLRGSASQNCPECGASISDDGEENGIVQKEKGDK